MGFDENRFINKTFVKPSPGGGAVPSSGLGNAFSIAASVFDNEARKARDRDLKADKERAVVLGQNSVTIDENGNVSRAAVPKDLTTPEGRALFVETQRGVAYTARANAMDRKGRELAVKYRNNPNGIQLFTEDMKEWGGQFINDADKDNAGRLGLIFEDVMKKGVINITQVIEDREWKEAVKQNDTLLATHLSNIQEGEMQGLTTEKYQTQLFDQLEIAVKAGWIDAETQTAYIKDSQISRYSGELFKRAMEAPKATLSMIRTKIKKELFKGGDKEAGFDMNNADRDKILDRVMKHINFVLHTKNLETQERDAVYADKMFPIFMSAADRVNRMTPGDLQTALMAAKITKADIARSPFLQRQMIVLERLTTDNKDSLDLLATRKLVAIYAESMVTATDENYEGRWKAIEKANEIGLFDKTPGAYVKFLNAHAAKIKAFLKAGKDRSDQGFEDMFSQLAIGGQLNDRIVSRLQATGKFGPDDKPDIKMMRWLQDNAPKVKGWYTRAHGDLGKVAKALARRADGGFSSGDSKHADILMDVEEKNRADANKEPLYNQNTKEGIDAIMARAIYDGIMSTRANDVLEKMAFSITVETAAKAAQLYIGLADDTSPKGGILRQSMKASTVKRLVMVAEYFRSGVAQDQESFTRYLDKRTGEDSERIVKYVKDIDKDKFNEMFDFNIQEAGSEEFGEALTNVIPTFFIINKFSSPKNAERPLRRLIAKDAGGEPPWFAYDVAQTSTLVTDQLHRMFRIKRLQFPMGDFGDKAAMEATVKDAMAAGLIGPTSYNPPRRRDSNGEFIEDNDDLVSLRLHPVESLFENSDQARAVVEDRVRTLIEKLPEKVRNSLPPVVRGWFSRRFRSIATLGNDALKEWIGWDDLVREGYIRFEPSIPLSTKSKKIYEITLQNVQEDRPESRSIVLGTHEPFEMRDWHQLNFANYEEYIHKQQGAGEVGPP